MGDNKYILFFDEADSLFGKRTEVNSANDRYANIEVGYLLQKMEEYTGITILATNLRNNIDTAFQRRLQHIVDFPLPTEKERKEIWLRIYPEKTPLKDIDFNFLAKKIKLTGGNIKNMAMNSAYFALSEGDAVQIRHVLRAVHREYEKIGKNLLRSDFPGYETIVDEILVGPET